MTPEEISVRQWQEMFQTGVFHQDGIHIREQAGWNDFYDPLNNKSLQNLAKLVMNVTHPFILDNYHVYFLQYTTGIGPRYGCLYFDVLSVDQDIRNFHVVLDCPYERKKWTLKTWRYGDIGPEYECGDIRRMARYINNMAHELEQGIQPEFIAESQAVVIYTKIYGEPLGIHIHREGEHCYSYTSFLDRKQRNVMAVASLEDAPSGFVAEHAEEIRGIHVYCPENAGKSPPSLMEAFAAMHPEWKKPSKKKEAER